MLTICLSYTKYFTWCINYRGSPDEKKRDRSRSKSPSPKPKRIPVWESEEVTPQAFKARAQEIGDNSHLQRIRRRYQENTEENHRQYDRRYEENKVNYNRYDRYREHGRSEFNRFENNDNRWEDKGYEDRRRPFNPQFRNYRDPKYHGEGTSQWPPQYQHGDRETSGNYCKSEKESAGSYCKNKVKLVDYWIRVSMYF